MSFHIIRHLFENLLNDGKQRKTKDFLTGFFPLIVMAFLTKCDNSSIEGHVLPAFCCLYATLKLCQEERSRI